MLRRLRKLLKLVFKYGLNILIVRVRAIYRVSEIAREFGLRSIFSVGFFLRLNYVVAPIC